MNGGWNDCDDDNDDDGVDDVRVHDKDVFNDCNVM